MASWRFPTSPRARPAGRKTRPIFIGCACDRKYAEPTAVMLSSVDANGQVPDAIVIVSAFDLDADSRALIRSGAGGLARHLRFVDMTREMMHEIDRGGFTDLYPVSVLGRLFIPNQISVPHARLLTLDSDMIVNASLRPLFALDMEDRVMAAIHDPPRIDDPDYFNSGLMLVDVDAYRRLDIASHCLQWIAQASNHPRWPDQDALNAVVGNNWHRLNREWNYFHYDGHFNPAGYERARVAHFAANPKPWDDEHHPGRPLYDRYREKVEHGQTPGCDPRPSANGSLRAQITRLFR